MVTLQYSFKDKEGYLKDYTKPETISYVQGRGHMLPGVERVLMGKNAGEHLQITLPPVDAFGEFQKKMLIRVPKDQFFGIPQLKPGMQFDMLENDGSIKIWTLVDVEETVAVLDGNHPLAGLNIEFDMTILHVHEMRQ